MLSQKINRFAKYQVYIKSKQGRVLWFEAKPGEWGKDAALRQIMVQAPAH